MQRVIKQLKRELEPGDSLAILFWENCFSSFRFEWDHILLAKEITNLLTNCEGSKTIQTFLLLFNF